MSQKQSTVKLSKLADMEDGSSYSGFMLNAKSNYIRYVHYSHTRKSIPFYTFSVVKSI